MQIEGWDFYKLEDIADINPSKSPRPENGLASFIPMESVSESAKMLNHQVKPYDEIEKGFTSFKNSDVLVAKITPCFENGKGALVENLENGIGFGSTEFHVLRANGKSISKYLYYLTNSHEFRIRGEMNMQGSAGQKRVTTDYLKSYKVNLPPIEEQKKIATILSTWDKAIEAVEKLVANSQQQKKALMQQLLTGQKRLLDDNGVQFSDSWKTYSFQQLGNTYTGLSGKNKEHFGKGKPYIPYMNIFKNSRIKLDNLELVDIAENENQNAVKYGDIFFTTSSETPAEVGMSSVLMQEIENVYLNSFCFGFRLNNFETLLPEFASHILRSQEIRKQISMLGQGATRYNLSKNQLMKLEIELPTIKEQEKIAQVLTLADREIDLYQQQLDKLKLEKKALMQQLLTGQKRVKLNNQKTA